MEKRSFMVEITDSVTYRYLVKEADSEEDAIVQAEKMESTPTEVVRSVDSRRAHILGRMLKPGEFPARR